MHRIKGIIQIYSKQARDQIIESVGKILGYFDLNNLSPELFACIDELIKNAIKSNYKFLLLRMRMIDKFRQLWPNKSMDEIEEDINDIIKIPESFNRLAEEVLKNEDISSIVRDILNEESKLLNIKNRSYQENRDYTIQEKEAIRKLDKINDIRKQLKDLHITTSWRIQADSDFIYIEITNTAPILARDISRIHEKRDEYKQYHLQGKEHEFFINNIDTSESGFGLGYAKIDVILNDWGITNERAITIISAISTTVMITLPVDILNTQLKAG